MKSKLYIFGLVLLPLTLSLSPAWGQSDTPATQPQVGQESNGSDQQPADANQQPVDSSQQQNVPAPAF